MDGLKIVESINRLQGIDKASMGPLRDEVDYDYDYEHEHEHD
jgi:hypothetical protein